MPTLATMRPSRRWGTRWDGVVSVGSGGGTRGEDSGGVGWWMPYPRVDMAKKKLRIGVLFGGRSGEHEISLLSAASILKAIDRKRFEVVPLGITKQGQWVGAGE